VAYTPSVWSDRIPGSPGQFSTTGTVPGNVTLTLNDNPSQAGTPVTAARMNNIETGISTLDGGHITGPVTTVGLAGATAASRYVGATASGAPATGTFAKGDFVVDQTGTFWICVTAGSPGTWAKPTNTGYQIITTTSTFTVPLGVTRIYVQMIGGGGGGAGGWGNATGTGLMGGVSGGGGGGYAAAWMSVTPGQQITATVGAGGAGGAGGSSSGSGNTLGGTGSGGGTTVFNGVGCYGGSGANPSNTTSGSAGGVGVGCPIVVIGGAGGYYSTFNSSGAPGGTAANNGVSGYGTGGQGGGESPGYSPNAGQAGSPGANGAVIIAW